MKTNIYGKVFEYTDELDLQRQVREFRELSNKRLSELLGTSDPKTIDEAPVEIDSTVLDEVVVVTDHADELPITSNPVTNDDTTPSSSEEPPTPATTIDKEKESSTTSKVVNSTKSRSKLR